MLSRTLEEAEENRHNYECQGMVPLQSLAKCGLVYGTLSTVVEGFFWLNKGATKNPKEYVAPTSNI